MEKKDRFPFQQAQHRLLSREDVVRRRSLRYASQSGRNGNVAGEESAHRQRCSEHTFCSRPQHTMASPIDLDDWLTDIAADMLKHLDNPPDVEHQKCFPEFK